MRHNTTRRRRGKLYRTRERNKNSPNFTIDIYLCVHAHNCMCAQLLLIRTGRVDVRAVRTTRHQAKRMRRHVAHENCERTLDEPNNLPPNASVCPKNPETTDTCARHCGCCAADKHLRALLRCRRCFNRWCAYIYVRKAKGASMTGSETLSGVDIRGR